MDKKNTMLLTVIAVATLLVAVVGATFAYFTVVASQSSSTTAGTVNVAQVGTLAIRHLDKNLYLNLTQNEMQKANAGTYYAGVDSSAVATKSATAVTHDIAEIALTGAGSGAAATTKYSCTATLTVSGDENWGKTLRADVENAKIVLGGTMMNLVTNAPASNTIALNGTGFGSDQTYNIEFEWTEDTTVTLNAALSIVNSETEEQNLQMSGLTMGVSIAVTGLTCTTTTIS